MTAGRPLDSTSLMTTAEKWVERDAARVGHGVTPMAASGAHRPGSVDRADTVGSVSVGAGESGTALLVPLRSGGVIRAPGYEKPRWLDEARRLVRELADPMPAVVIEPLVQGAAGMWVADPADVNAFA